MIRPACLRALVLTCTALIGLAGNPARAGQSEPAASEGQADHKPQPAAAGAQNNPNQQPANPTAPPGGANAQQPGAPPQPTGGLTPPPPIPQTAPGLQPPTATGPTPAVETPAQAKYGLPRNPIYGGPTDIDLSKPLTLERAIRIGLQRHNSIAIARAARDANSARVIQARASYFPQVTPSLIYQTSRRPAYLPQSSSTFTPAVRDASGATGDTSTGSVGGTSAPFGAGSINRAAAVPVAHAINSESRTDAIAASWLLLDSGQRDANVGFARRNLFAAEYGLGNTRQDVVVNITESYYNLLRDRALIKVQQTNVQLEQTTLESIQAQVQVGNAAQSDTLQAQSALSNAQVSLIQAQSTAYTDEATLKNAMGVVTSASLVLADENVPAPSATPDTRSLDSYVQQAYLARLDLKQLQELVNAQGYEVRLANINAGIQVNATIDEGYQLDPNAGEERTFTVSLSYPLFDAGLTRAVVKENKEVLEQQQRNLDQGQQNVRLSVEQDYVTRELSRQQVAAANVAVQAGQNNYNVALEKQRNGLINILDVLNAEVQLVTAQVQQVNSVYDYYIEDARLQRDIGANDPDFVPRVPGAPKAPPMQLAPQPPRLRH